jgi:hypothetical protein
MHSCAGDLSALPSLRMTPLESDSSVADRVSCTAPAYSTNGEPDLQALAQLLAMELRRGRHIGWSSAPHSPPIFGIGIRGSSKCTYLRQTRK